DTDAHRGQLGDTGHQVVPGQALAIHDFTCVIHAYRVKHALGDIDPEDVYLVLHGTRLLWLNRFTDRERIVAHCRRSAQGRVHFITTGFSTKREWGNRKCRTPHGQVVLERSKSLLVSRQCRGHPSIAIVLQSGSVEHVEMYGDFTPGSAGSLIGKM